MPEPLEDIFTDILRRLDETARRCASVEHRIDDLARYSIDANRITAEAMAAEDEHLQRTGSDVQRLAAEMAEARTVLERIATESASLTRDQVAVRQECLDRDLGTLAAVEGLSRRLTPLEALAGRWPEVDALTNDVRDTQAAIASLRADLVELQQRARRRDPAPTPTRAPRHASGGFALTRVAASVLATAVFLFASYFWSTPAPGVQPGAALPPTLTAAVAPIVSTPPQPNAPSPQVIAASQPIAPPQASARPRQSASSAAATTGRLVVTSEPAGARVTVDGIGWGVTPATIDHVSLGRKRVRVVKDGYIGEEAVVALTANRPRSAVRVTLRPRGEGTIAAVRLSSMPVDTRALMAANVSVPAVLRPDDAAGEQARKPHVIKRVGRVLARAVGIPAGRTE